MTTDTSEKSLEILVSRVLSGTGHDRTRLIADVVTGKVDVRDTAVKFPDAPTEEEGELLDESDAAGLNDAQEDHLEAQGGSDGR